MQPTIDNVLFAAELEAEMRRQGLSAEALATRLGLPDAGIAALLDPGAPADPGRAAAAARALGRGIALTLAPERPSVALARHRDALREILQSRGFTDVLVFGSVARGEDTPASDLDLVADIPDELSLLAVAAIADELSEALGRHVDLAERRALQPHVRAEVEREGVPL